MGISLTGLAAAAMAVAGAVLALSAAAEAGTRTVARVAWPTPSADGQAARWSAPTAGGISYHYDGTAPGSANEGLDIGWDTIEGYVYWQPAYGEWAVGFDRGEPCVAMTMVVANPSDPLSPGVMFTVLTTGESLTAGDAGPPEEAPPPKKRGR